MYTKIEIGSALKNARLSKNLTTLELANKAQVAKSSISDWENGKTQPSADALFRICDALNLTPSELFVKSENKTKRIPVLGTIPAGIPLEAIEEILDYEEISEDMAKSGEFFALKVKGDSMLPTIKDGDIVILKKSEDCESGKICAVYINGYDATLKEIKKDLQGIWVLPHNPNADFKPTFFSNQEISSTPVKIIGVAVEIRRSL